MGRSYDMVIAALALSSVVLLGSMVRTSAEAGEAPTAQPIRLIGMCNGQLLGAMEEDQFPAPCEWIEGVNMQPQEEIRFDD